ncbi:hypothetical protein MMC09_005289 [Bachmanniomyces sp. S44760]|nr:hypothetical protein [Bachmanniomyces sp. S44760]
MLLTSGQISMTISSCVVFVFTSLLFLSGYVLQQQTVRSLQAALKPPPPPVNSLPEDAEPSAAPVARPFGSPLGSSGHAAYEAGLGSGGKVPGGWNKVAYVQLLRHPVHTCNAVMLFADLAKQNSPAKRVLLYPRLWDHAVPSQNVMTASHDTSVRLLQMAAQKYGVSLLPIDPVIELDGGNRKAPNDSIRAKFETDNFDVAYPVTGLLSITTLDRVLYLPPSGMMLNSSKLDDLFTVPMYRTIEAIAGPSEEKTHASSSFLINPSMHVYREAIASLSTDATYEASWLRNLTQQPPTTPGSDISGMITKTSDFAVEDGGFNLDDVLDNAAYVQFSDLLIPGPEYDISREILTQSRPQNGEARRLWNALYERYRSLRMDVCGLDLEPPFRPEK